MGEIIPADITIFMDGSFKFELKSPPAAIMIKKAAGVAKGSANPRAESVGQVTKAQLKEIAEVKYKDMNANDIEAAIRQLEGTARNMGIKVVEK